MIKKISSLLFILTALFLNQYSYAEEDFNFENFTIEESGDVDINEAPITLNSDAELVMVDRFDIAGIMLGMSFEEINNQFFKDKGLYAPTTKNSIIYGINKDWKYNLDYECRQNNIVKPSEIAQCINSLAQKRGLLYVSEVHLFRENTGETIDVFFTSNTTDNVVWRVVYNNDANEVEGNAEKFSNQREKKILSFWQGVLDKYGAPNSGSDKWVSSTNAYEPMMTAYYGQLDLIDKGIMSVDSARNIQLSKEEFQSKPYAF